MDLTFFYFYVSHKRGSYVWSKYTIRKLIQRATFWKKKSSSWDVANWSYSIFLIKITRNLHIPPDNQLHAASWILFHDIFMHKPKMIAASQKYITFSAAVTFNQKVNSCRAVSLNFNPSLLTRCKFYHVFDVDYQNVFLENPKQGLEVCSPLNPPLPLPLLRDLSKNSSNFLASHSLAVWRNSQTHFSLLKELPFLGLIPLPIFVSYKLFYHVFFSIWKPNASSTLDAYPSFFSLAACIHTSSSPVLHHKITLIGNFFLQWMSPYSLSGDPGCWWGASATTPSCLI